MKWIAPLPDAVACSHPLHEPPRHAVFPPGVYEHTCPKCGSIGTYIIPRRT